MVVGDVTQNRTVLNSFKIGDEKKDKNDIWDSAAECS